jgi:hypothetical protein
MSISLKILDNQCDIFALSSIATTFDNINFSVSVLKKKKNMELRLIYASDCTKGSEVHFAT